MRKRRAYIGWPCVHGSMYQVTATFFVPPFYRPSVPSGKQETVPQSYHSTLPPATPCHLLPTCRNRVAVPPGVPPKHHRATCHQHAATVSPCYLWRPVPPPCHHRATTVPPPCHQVTCCATVPPPCRRATWCAAETTSCHRATWCTTTTPPCHCTVGLPPYRQDTSAYLRTPTHLA